MFICLYENPIMKRLLSYLLFLSVAASGVWAQNFDYGNSWYQTAANQTWVKLVVDQDGVYRVSKTALINEGYPISTIAANRLRLYYRGKEVPIYVNGSGVNWQYLEFFGLRNDGRVDSTMYVDPFSLKLAHGNDEQPNKAISLFSDESGYFLTWNNTPSSARYFSQFDPTYNLYTPETSFRYRAYREFHPNDPQTRYVTGGSDAIDARFTLNTEYVTGEGYQGPGFGVGSPVTVPLATPAIINDGLPLEFETRVFGRSLSTHFLQVMINGNASNPVLDTAFLTSTIYQKTFFREYFPASALNQTTDFTFSAAAAGVDNSNVSYLALTYTRAPNFTGDSSFWVQNWTNNQKAYLRLNGVGGDDSVFVYDLRNQFRNVGVIQGNQARVIVQGFGNGRNLFVATDKAIRTPRIESPRLNRLFDPNAGAEYVIITDRKLAASAQAYAQYRDTATVTPLSSVKVVYVDEIYDEFGYGSVTSLAIKRFCKYAMDNWNTKPEYFLLWGKGKYRTREHNPAYPLVPTYGYPASDYEYVCNWRQDTIELRPEAAIGRINIQSDTEGLDYLQKINDYEHSTWEPWMKKGVFLGGGGSEAEQNAISSALVFMINRFKGLPVGGKVTYFQKRESSIVIDPNEATYHDQISGGTQILHFFGHSTANINDVSIREPFEYNNFGRYPFMIAMGCYGGDFTVGSDPSGASFGERWVREKGRGSIAYLGNSSIGNLFPLKSFGEVYYNLMYRNLNGQPVGKVLQTVLPRYVDSLKVLSVINHGRQMNLQGDPALKLYVPEAPDLSITNASVFFTPDNFTAQDDSFRISLIVDNLGLVTNDSFDITIRQRLPDGSVFDHPTLRRQMVFDRDTISASLINPVGDLLTGQNFFEIFVDAEDEIEEYNEQNNFVSVGIIVPGNIPAILSPREYAIVPDNKVTLQASTVFMTTDKDVGFVFEIDTKPTFDSPAKVNSGNVVGSSILATWEVPFPLVDSTVYYWRVRLTNVSPQVWVNASFRYIQTRTGWAQSQLPQFPKNTFDNLLINELQQRWEFGKFASEYDFSTREGGSFIFSINGSLVVDLSNSGVYFDQVAFIVLDQYTLEPKLNFPISGPVGSARPPEQLFKLRNVINQAANGDYVIVGSQQNPRVPEWSEDIFDALKLIGVSDDIRQVKDGKPFIVMGRKGASSGAIEVYSPTAETKYSINTILFAPYDQGSVTSTLIGPALSWESLWWDWRSLDTELAETMTTAISAVRTNGSDSLMFNGLPDGTTNFSTLDASLYPYLRLEAKGRDTARRTAPQLDHWHVLYSPAPDLTVDAITSYAFEADTLEEGKDLYLKLGARNISEIDVEDSVQVILYVNRQDRARVILDSLMLPPLAEGAYAPIEFRVNTLGLGLDGLVSVNVEVNPQRRPVEQHYFNNLFSQAVFIVVDNENPILDVTFDGKHIINGDFVSPEPEIVIEVNDENPFLALDDTAAFEIYLRTGISTLNEVRIFVGDPRVEWLPGTLPENKARIYFYPGRIEPLADGVYGLRVQGKDKRNNPSGRGANLYGINFEVVSKSTVTRILNYPNPFSSSTRFVYSLTGSEMPEMFQIHIYTISGKMVKMVDLMELGDVHFGHNLTQYAWDGTDEYGDQLANGVYLYKVYIKMPSEDLELRDTGTEQFFRNGWGKMYLMR